MRSGKCPESSEESTARPSAKVALEAMKGANQIQTWKKALMDGAAAIFDQGNGTNKGKKQKNKNNDALVARLDRPAQGGAGFLGGKVRSMTPARRRW